MTKLLIIFAGFTYPWYIMPPGFPQITNLFLLCAVIAYSFHQNLNTHRHVYLLNGFVLYAFFLSLMWSIFESNASIAKHPVYYIYNLGIFLLFFSLIINSRRDIVEIFLKISIIMMFVSVLAFFDLASLRQKGGFNNPNQLGFAALSLFINLFLLQKNDFMKIQNFKYHIMCGCCVILSFSLTSIFCFFVAYILIIAFRQGENNKLQKVLKILTVTIILLVLFSLSQMFEYLIDTLWSRLDLISKKLEEAYEVRGYSRLADFPQYLFFGAAESGFSRFNVHNFEIHSLFAGVIFSYGILGSLFFYMFLVQIIKGYGLVDKLIIALPFSYSLTHFTLRDTNLWITFAIILGVSLLEKKRLVAC